MTTLTGPATGAARPAPPARSTRPPRVEPRPGGLGEGLAVFSSATTIVAIVCAWMLVQLLVLGGLSQQRSQHLLYDELRGQLAAATAPTGALDYNGAPVESGAPVALLTIPRLDESQVVVSGTSSGDLLAGPGAERDQVLPGQQGTAVVMGRAATYGAPFGHLADLRPGDHLRVRNAQGVVEYTVRDLRRAGDPIPAVPTGKGAGRLVLASADRHGFLGALRARSVVYVDADTTSALPAGPTAGAVPDSERLMARDTTALPVLVLLLALLVALVLAVAVARRHVRATLVWLVAAPAAIALAWAVTDQVMRLLPNLM